MHGKLPSRQRGKKCMTKDIVPFSNANFSGNLVDHFVHFKLYSNTLGQ